MIASDDVLRPSKTSVLMKCIQGDDSVAGAFSGCELIDESGAIVGVIEPTAGNYVFGDIMDREATIVTPSQLLRLDSVRAVGGYAEDLYFEDWYMWLALTRRGFKLKVISEVLVQYRQHDRRRNQGGGQDVSGPQSRARVLQGRSGVSKEPVVGVLGSGDRFFPHFESDVAAVSGGSALALSPGRVYVR